MQDKFGNFITNGVTWDPNNLFVLEAETLALKEAIQNAISLNLDHIVCESDTENSKFYSIIINLL